MLGSMLPERVFTFYLGMMHPDVRKPLRRGSLVEVT